MSVNQIGTFRFVSLSRPPEIVQDDIVVRMRPGVDGVMLQRVGARAKQFQVVSVVDAWTIGDAMQLYVEYADMVGGDAVPIVWADQAMGIIDHWVYVVRVEPVNIRRVVRGHGGLNGVSYARCECLWTLQPVKVEPETE